MARRLMVPRGTEDEVIAEAIFRTRFRQETKASRPKGDPVTYVRDVLHDDPWEMQETILESVRDNPRTTVRKCHSSGGTRAAAQAVAWWLHEYDDGVVYTLAPSWPQVHDLLWKDLAHLYETSAVPLGGRFFPASCRWEFGPRRYAIGRSTDKPERLQGPHGGHFLLIIDEASGFPLDLEQAVEGMLASGETRLLLMSQPTQLSGMFFRSHHSERSLYKTYGISAYDTPNLKSKDDEEPRPYLVRRRWVEERRRKWGENSPLYQVRVLGKFPRQATDTLIGLDWIENGYVVPHSGRQRTLGVDVARFGSDFTAYTYMIGNSPIRMWRRQGRSLMETAGEIRAMYNDHKKKGRDLVIVVDDTGLGGGVTDRLREENLDVIAVNFGASAVRLGDDVEKRGSELWWQLREALRSGTLSLGELANDPDFERELLEEQLLQPTYTFTSTGKIKVQKLGVDGKEPSPDLGDSLALAWEGALQESTGVGASGAVEDVSVHGGERPSMFSERRSRVWGG